MKIKNIWFDPPHVRWGRVVATAALLFVPLLAWMAYERGLWSGDAVIPARNAVLLSPAAVRPASIGPSAGLQSIRSTARAASGPQEPGADEFEVCGVGTFKVSSDPDESSALMERIYKLRSASARAKWLKAMQSSADVRVRGTGLALEASNPEGEWPSDQAEQGKRIAECAGDKTCVAQLNAQQVQISDAKRSAPRDELARLAHASRDPVVYAFAMNLCSRRFNLAETAGPAGACQMLSDAEWVSLAPDNAHPWLAHADRSSGSEAMEALYRASKAKTYLSYWGQAHSLAMSAAPAGTPALDRSLMSMEAMAFDEGTLLAMLTASRQCAAPLLADANRAQTCNALAELLVSESDTWLPRRIGERLGERLGWAPERLASLRDESEGLLEAATSIAPVLGLSCKELEDMTAYFGEVARLGEIGAARQAQRRSGKSLAEWAQLHRERLKELQDNVAQQEAAAASAPASSPGAAAR